MQTVIDTVGISVTVVLWVFVTTVPVVFFALCKGYGGDLSFRDKAIPTTVLVWIASLLGLLFGGSETALAIGGKVFGSSGVYGVASPLVLLWFVVEFALVAGAFLVLTLPLHHWKRFRRFSNIVFTLWCLAVTPILLLLLLILLAGLFSWASDLFYDVFIRP